MSRSEINGSRSITRTFMLATALLLLAGCGGKNQDAKSLLASLESKSLRTGVVETYVVEHDGKLIVSDKANNNVRIFEPMGELDAEHQQLPVREIIYEGYSGMLDQVVIDAANYACVSGDERADILYSFSFERINDVKFALESIEKSEKCKGKQDTQTLRDRLLAAKSALKQSRVNENMFLTKYAANGKEGFVIKSDAVGAVPDVYAFDRKLSPKEREEVQAIALNPRHSFTASDARIDKTIDELVENLAKPEVKRFNKILLDFTDLAQAGLENRLMPTDEVIEWIHVSDGVITATVAPGVIGSESCGNITFTPRMVGVYQLWSYATTCPEPAQSLVAKWNERAYK